MAKHHAYLTIFLVLISGLFLVNSASAHQAPNCPAGYLSPEYLGQIEGSSPVFYACGEAVQVWAGETNPQIACGGGISKELYVFREDNPELLVIPYEVGQITTAGNLEFMISFIGEVNQELNYPVIVSSFEPDGDLIGTVIIGTNLGEFGPYGYYKRISVPLIYEPTGGYISVEIDRQEIEIMHDIGAGGKIAFSNFNFSYSWDNYPHYWCSTPGELPTPTNTATPLPTQTPGGATATPTNTPRNTSTPYPTLPPITRTPIPWPTSTIRPYVTLIPEPSATPYPLPTLMQIVWPTLAPINTQPPIQLTVEAVESTRESYYYSMTLGLEELSESWTVPLEESWGVLEITGTQTISSTSETVAEFTQYISFPIALFKSLVHYTPTTWPIWALLIAAVAWELLVEMIKVAIAVVATLAEYVRRLWESIPLN